MILALDSSASTGSVALVGNDGKPVRELAVETPRGRGGRMFSALEEILSDAPRIDRVVVGTGPGSYNGLRASISAGWGIAFARGVPIVGVSSLLGLADGEYLAAGDARRGQFYFAHVVDGKFASDPVLLDADSLSVAVARGSLPVHVPGEITFLPTARVLFPSATRLARIGARALAGVPEPLYLKPACITMPRPGIGARGSQV